MPAGLPLGLCLGRVCLPAAPASAPSAAAAGGAQVLPSFGKLRTGPSASSGLRLGSQRIALRISGDPEPAKNGLFFFYVDHPSAALRTGLGGTSLLSTITGTLAAGSETRFLPYGEHRVEPMAGLTGRVSDRTDKGFHTG